jgi:hypothetical protein
MQNVQLKLVYEFPYLKDLLGDRQRTIAAVASKRDAHAPAPPPICEKMNRDARRNSGGKHQPVVLHRGEKMNLMPSLMEEACRMKRDLRVSREGVLEAGTHADAAYEDADAHRQPLFWKRT